MKNTLLFSILIFSLIGCYFSEPKIILESPQLETSLQWKIDDLKTFIDSTLTDSVDLSEILTVKSIDNSDNIENISFNQGIKLYHSITQSDLNNTYLIFEVIKSPFSILIIKGNGQWGNIWGKVLINKESQEIIKIDFDHESETPEVGANFSDSLFESRFAHKKISFDKELFALKNNGSAIAKYRIDAASNATITCDSAIQMINKEIVRYKKYLR